MSSQKPASNVAQVSASLFVTSQPLTDAQLCEIAGIEQDQLRGILTVIEKQIAPLGLMLVHDDGGYMLAVDDTVRPAIQKYFARHAQPLSSAALEVLTIIAYHQPVTKAHIDQARGVSSEASIKTLLSRSLIRAQDAKSVEPKYVTTPQFLALIGIKDLKALPIVKGLKRADQ